MKNYSILEEVKMDMETIDGMKKYVKTVSQKNNWILNKNPDAYVVNGFYNDVRKLT